MSFILTGEFWLCSLHDVLKNSLRRLKTSARNLGRELLSETMVPKGKCIWSCICVYVFLYTGIFAQCNSDFGIGEIGIRNSTNEWNQESKFPWQRFGIQYLEFKAWNPESKTVLDFLFLGRGIWFQSPLWASRHLFLWSLRTLNS